MSVWNTLAKAQAKTLKDALTTQGHTLTLSQCREARSHLAGYPNWNPYCARLKEYRASTRLPDQPERLIQELAAVGLSLPLEEAIHALTQMRQASAGVWEAEVQRRGITLTTLHVRNPDSPYGEQIQSWLEQNEDAILDTLALARPTLPPLIDDELEVTTVLQYLYEMEGPGHLTHFEEPDGGDVWVYTRTLEEAHILAVLFAEQSPLPDHILLGDLPHGLARLGQWPPTRADAERWQTREGLEAYLTELKAKYPSGFPRNAGCPEGRTPEGDELPNPWEAAEILALEARLTPAPHPVLSGEWERVHPQQVRNGDTLLIDLAVVTVREIEGFQGGYFSLYSTDGGVWDVPVSDPLWRSQNNLPRQRQGETRA